VTEEGGQRDEVEGSLPTLEVDALEETSDPARWLVAIEALAARGRWTEALAVTRRGIAAKGRPVRYGTLVSVCARMKDREGVLHAVRLAGLHGAFALETLRGAPEIAFIEDDPALAVVIDRYGSVPRLRERFAKMLAGYGPPDDLLQALGVALEWTPLSTRELQACAALGIAAYAAHHRLYDARVEALLTHLITFLTEVDLPEWERRGAVLELSGRGDPVPPDLIAHLSVDARGAFSRAVDDAVEVGIGNLYGASTEDPWVHFDGLAKALTAAGVTAPPVPPMFGKKLGKGINQEAPSPQAHADYVWAACADILRAR
jgi:hypothetical protein